MVHKDQLEKLNFNVNDDIIEIQIKNQQYYVISGFTLDNRYHQV